MSGRNLFDVIDERLNKLEEKNERREFKKAEKHCLKLFDKCIAKAPMGGWHGADKIASWEQDGPDWDKFENGRMECDIALRKCMASHNQK